MKILRIHLHPFGGVADRAYELHDGLNVIEGPNEFGKSTLNNALWHVLFTQSNLTPAKLRDTMGRWFPKPSGDHVRVTLEFEAQGQKWTLQKCWGAGASSSLKSRDSAAIADPARVQERLSQLLQRNEATWRHVLFVNQAQLNRTIHELRENSAQVDDLQPLLAGAAAIPGDIAPDKLAMAIDSRIEDHFSRWDRVANGPEKGRGIDNPWANKIGPLLSAYYSMESTRRELGEVLDYEKRLDRINADIRDKEATIETDREFVAKGKSLRDGLAKRDGLEEKIKRLQGERDALKKVLVDWPGADQVIRNKQEEAQRITATIESLDKELGNAKKRASAEQLRKSYGHLVEARKNLQSAAEKLGDSKEIPAETLKELKTLGLAIDGLRIQIAAQKLSARLESKSPVKVTVARGVEASETIEVDPSAPWEGQAEGKLRLDLENLSVEVASGTGDVQVLFTQLEEKTIRQQEILDDLKLSDLSAVELADRDHQQRISDERNARKIYDAALQGKSEEEWTAEIAALDALPDTRSVSVLEGERTIEVNKKAKLEVEIQQVQQNVEKWVQEHTDLDSLTAKILDKATELAGAEKDLASLPELPNGYESVASYLEELRQKERSQSEIEEALKALKIEHAGLTGAAPKHSAEELREALEVKERAFQREEATGKALLRIRAKLDEIVADRGNEDPMKNVETAIAGHFHELTCGAYANVRLDGGTPVEVTGRLTLGTESLSQGTLGSLALATRLALADLYLEALQGFLVLDDPFTDMDPARRRAAAQCLGTFAGKRQVIFFTCHPDHEGELKELAGAKTPTINGNR